MMAASRKGVTEKTGRSALIMSAADGADSRPSPMGGIVISNWYYIMHLLVDTIMIV